MLPLPHKKNADGSNQTPTPQDAEESLSEDDPEVEESKNKNKVNYPSSGSKTWDDLNLAKPLMKAIQDLGYASPTIIQELTIPAIVTGRDVLASSITGSGKTAAFLLPLIQKFWKAKYGYNVSNYSKALIILPTRELAIQCHDMFHGLNKYTKLSSTLIIGQASIQQQEMELRRGPDFIIGTPGRMID